MLLRKYWNNRLFSSCSTIYKNFTPFLYIYKYSTNTLQEQSEYDCEEDSQDTEQNGNYLKQYVKGALQEKAKKNLLASEQTSRHRSIEDLADACRSLVLGKRYKQAEVMLKTIVEKSSVMDTSLVNLFIEYYLNAGHEQKALALFEKLGIQADVHSFYLLLNYRLKNKELGKLEHLVMEATRRGVPLMAIVTLPGWSPEDRQVLTPLLAVRDPMLAAVHSMSYPAITIPENIPNTLNHPLSEDINVIERVDSALSGIEIMAKALQSLQEFDLSGRASEDTLYYAQMKLEEASGLAAKEMASARLVQMSKLVGDGSRTSETVAGALMNGGVLAECVRFWTHQLTEWLTKEIEGRLERSLGQQMKLPHLITDSEVNRTDANFFCALLSPLTPSKIAMLTINELISLKGFDGQLGGVKVIGVAKSVGKRVREEIFAEQILTRPFLNRLPYSPADIRKMITGWEGRKELEAAAIWTREKYSEELQEAWLPEWSNERTIQIGSWLIANAISLFKMDPDDPTTNAFSHLVTYDPATTHRQGIIRPSRDLLKVILAPQQTQLFADPWALPMLVPPRPWVTFKSGGYLTRKSVCVRLKQDPVHEQVLKEADKEGLLDQIKRGLDILGSTAWKVNEPVLKVQIALWNQGIELKTLKQFPKYTPLPKPQFRPGDQKLNRSEKMEWNKLNRLMSEQLSNKCDANYKLEVAKQFAKAEKFYLPHTVDFRGRAYTIPPHLTHISSDTARGLLLFWEGRRVGTRGLYWLKVHLANTFGFDKASLDDRVAFTEKHMGEIEDSAKNPLNDNGWWRDAEDPWQCLAACMELSNAHKLLNPEDYVCSLPVQQDGSCNGLQHYAALGGDPEGAAKVNLAPFSTPQDVYRSVAELVIKRIDADLKFGSEEDLLLANMLQGKVNRKIVKTTVMTNVYGVTEYGAKQQLQGKLKESGILAETDKKIQPITTYLTKLVFSSLKELFVQARLIQDWLCAAAKEITHSLPLESAQLFGHSEELEVPKGLYSMYTYRRPRAQDEDSKSPESVKNVLTRYPQTMVSWTTPFSFIVIQPYTKTQVLKLHTALQQISVQTPGPADPVDHKKQTAAFAPNYIHSLDATHMFMTATECAKQGIAFASVHDCFWTHADSVDTMSRIIREQFVALYKQPILSNLREELVKRYSGYKVPVKQIEKREQQTMVYSWRDIHFAPVPERGPFEIEKVLQSTYFFS